MADDFDTDMHDVADPDSAPAKPLAIKPGKYLHPHLNRMVAPLIS
jgi:hypothetical protein